MTDNEKLSCLIDRPCTACKFHKEEGCSKWSCIFEEKSDVPEREKGEWIPLYPNDPDLISFECKSCGEEQPFKWNFCPNCGADMRAEHNDGLICTECECKDECDGIEYMSKDQCEKKRGWQ